MRERASIAICLDDREVSVVARGATSSLVSKSTAWDGLPDTLAAAIEPLIAAVPPADSATFVLRRPIAQMRTIAMPPMPQTAAERVLARDWARHVIGLRATDHTVSAIPLTRGRWRAVFAPTDLLETLADLAHFHGWKSFDIRAGDDVLADSMAKVASDDRSGQLIVIVCDANGPTDACHVRRGHAIAGRRFVARSNERDVSVFAQSTASGARIAIVGDATQANALARALVAQGLRAGAPSITMPGPGAAAAFATLAGVAKDGLVLRSPSMMRQRARQFRRATLLVSAAAAVALIAALAVEQRRLATDLDRIRQQRADLSGPVSNAVARRAAVQSTVDLVTALAAREQEATRRSDVLSLVTLALPSGTALTLLNVSGDTLSIEGESAHSAAVYQSLRVLPVLSQVKLSSPLRQERQAGDVAVEHFAFTARITPIGAHVTPVTR